QRTGRGNPTGSLFIYYIAFKKFASFSDHPYRAGTSRRLDRWHRPSTGLGLPDMGRIGPEKNPVRYRPVSIRSPCQVAGQRRERSQDTDGGLAETGHRGSEMKGYTGQRDTGINELFHYPAIPLPRCPSRLIRWARQPAPNPLSMFI